jgi:hypothetical protein
MNLFNWGFNKYQAMGIKNTWYLLNVYTFVVIFLLGCLLISYYQHKTVQNELTSQISRFVEIVNACETTTVFEVVNSYYKCMRGDTYDEKKIRDSITQKVAAMRFSTGTEEAPLAQSPNTELLTPAEHSGNLIDHGIKPKILPSNYHHYYNNNETEVHATSSQ